MEAITIDSIQSLYSQLDGPLVVLGRDEAVGMVTALQDEGYSMVAGMLVAPDQSVPLRGHISDLRVNVGKFSEDPGTVVGPYVMKACVMRDGTAFGASVMLDGSIGLWTRNVATAA